MRLVYYHNGCAIALPGTQQLRSDRVAIAEYIKSENHYDDTDVQIIEAYQQQLESNRKRLLALEDDAFEFIKHTVNDHSPREILVSFSGGKDSTVVSDLVRRALGRADILHIFGDTKLEDENTGSDPSQCG